MCLPTILTSSSCNGLRFVIKPQPFLLHKCRDINEQTFEVEKFPLRSHDTISLVFLTSTQNLKLVTQTTYLRSILRSHVKVIQITQEHIFRCFNDQQIEPENLPHYVCILFDFLISEKYIWQFTYISLCEWTPAKSMYSVNILSE